MLGQRPGEAPERRLAHDLTDGRLDDGAMYRQVDGGEGIEGPPLVEPSLRLQTESQRERCQDKWTVARGLRGSL